MCQDIPLYALQHKEKKTFLQYAGGLPLLFTNKQLAETYLRLWYDSDSYEPIEIIIQQRFP